jgi:hypothetical protein
MHQSIVPDGSTIPSPGDFDRKARERLAAILYLRYGDKERLGTLARSQLILQILLRTYPTPALSAAYFENLDRLLTTRKKLPSPGRLVLGLGAGRCGSTSLTALMATIEGGCCTHENPPLIFWEPQDEQVAFHMRRFALLRQYFPLAFDAAHWWLNVMDRMFAIFPDAKVVGLCRDLEPSVQSFMHVKGRGRNSVNHWVSHDNGIWQPNNWDLVYPTYSLPDDAQADPDRAKADVIRRYVSDYNRDLESLADRFPGRVMLVQTEKLGRTSEQQRVFDFVGLPGRLTRVHLNAGTLTDGTSHGYRF